MDNLWLKTINFHGHECPGLAIGFKAAIACREYLLCSSSKDEEIVCVSENNACCIDAIQVILGCTSGKGNLIINLKGKMVFHFYNRQSGKSIRVSLKDSNSSFNRDEYKKYLLSSTSEDIFHITESTLPPPEKAKIYKSIRCESCGEKTAEPFIRVYEGALLCDDCFNFK